MENKRRERLRKTKKSMPSVIGSSSIKRENFYRGLREKPPKESKTVYGKAISQVGVSDNDDINKYAQFLEEVSKVFNQFVTSVKFTVWSNMLENVYQMFEDSWKSEFINYRWETCTIKNKCLALKKITFDFRFTSVFVCAGNQYLFFYCLLAQTSLNNALLFFKY